MLACSFGNNRDRVEGSVSMGSEGPPPLRDACWFSLVDTGAHQWLRHDGVGQVRRLQGWWELQQTTAGDGVLVPELQGAGDTRTASFARDYFDDKLVFVDHESKWVVAVKGSISTEVRDFLLAQEFQPRAFVFEFAFGSLQSEVFVGKFTRHGCSAWWSLLTIPRQLHLSVYRRHACWWCLFLV